MRSVAISLSLTGLFLFLPACDKDDDQHALEKGLRGRVLYTSCVTIAVQVLNSNTGSTWTNCHDQQTYEHVLDAALSNATGIKIEPGRTFTFDIVTRAHHAACYMLDCAPSESATIRITDN